jgi:hypothetical protein
MGFCNSYKEKNARYPGRQDITLGIRLGINKKLNTMYTNSELGWDFDPFQSDEIIYDNVETTEKNNIELPF